MNSPLDEALAQLRALLKRNAWRSASVFVREDGRVMIEVACTDGLVDRMGVFADLEPGGPDLAPDAAMHMKFADWGQA